MPYEFHAIETDANSISLACASQHCQRSKTVEELIFNWLTPGRTINIVPGKIENTTVSSLSLLLEDEQQGIGVVDIALDHFPTLEPVTNAVSYSAGRDKWFQQRNESLQLCRNSDLPLLLLCKTDALRVAASYAQCIFGEAYFSLVDSVAEIAPLNTDSEEDSWGLVCVGYFFTDCRSIEISQVQRFRLGWSEHFGVLLP